MQTQKNICRLSFNTTVCCLFMKTKMFSRRNARIIARISGLPGRARGIRNGCQGVRASGRAQLHDVVGPRGKVGVPGCEQLAQLRDRQVPAIGAFGGRPRIVGQRLLADHVLEVGLAVAPVAEARPEPVGDETSRSCCRYRERECRDCRRSRNGRGC